MSVVFVRTYRIECDAVDQHDRPCCPARYNADTGTLETYASILDVAPELMLEAVAIVEGKWSRRAVLGWLCPDHDAALTKATKEGANGDARG